MRQQNPLAFMRRLTWNLGLKLTKEAKMHPSHNSQDAEGAP